MKAHSFSMASHGLHREPTMPDLDSAPGTIIDPEHRIDPHTSASVTEWAEKLGVGEDEIIDAVTAVGDRVADVERHLTSKGDTR